MKSKKVGLSFASDEDFRQALGWFDEYEHVEYDLPGGRDIIVPRKSLSYIEMHLPVSFTSIDVISAADVSPETVHRLRTQRFLNEDQPTRIP